MPNYALPRLRRIFAQIQTGGFTTINNTSGTWDPTGAAYIRASENAVRLTPVMPKTENPVLTGTRSMQPGTLGRKSATWELNNVPIIPSGTAGTPPDMDPLLKNLFGQAPTVVVGTSVTYSFLDSGFLPLTLLDFYHGVPTLIQRLMWGGFCQEATITFNTNIFTVSFRGIGGYRLDTANFSNEDVGGKAGLTTYPSEPGSVTYNGNVMPGFYGSVTIDSQSGLEFKISEMQIRISTGDDFIPYVIGNAYPQATAGGPRRVGVAIKAVDDDSATLADLKQKAKSNAAVDGTIIIGQTAGAKCQFNVKSLQLVTEDYTDNTTYTTADFPESFAHASAIGSTDDLTWAWL